MKFSAYSHKKFTNEDINTVVDSMVSLTEKYASLPKNDTKAKEEYETLNSMVNEKFMKVCIENSGMEFSGVDMIQDPMVTSRSSFRDTFNSIIAQVIAPLAPAVTSNEFNMLAEVRQIGYGQTASFVTKSNDLFLVNEIAEGVQRGNLQTLYNGEFTVNATNATIDIFVDWYHIASGIFDWGEFSYKMGASYQAYIQSKIIVAMNSVITDMASSPYYANGFSDANWIKIAQKVKAANGNADVYAMGTLSALGTVLPSDTGLKYGLGEEIAKRGYLNSYKNVPVIEIGNAMQPGTINTTATLMIADDTIYFVGLGLDHPVKVVFEGNNVTVANDAKTTTDKTYGMNITMKVGVGAVVGAKVGAIHLS